MNKRRPLIGSLKQSAVHFLAMGYRGLVVRKKLAYFIVPLFVGLLLFGITPTSSTQIPIQTVPDWIGLPVTLQMNVSAMSNPASTHEELPGLGHKFELIGAMMDDHDPDNPTNDTISATMTLTNFALAFRNLPPGVKIAAFDNQLGFKYYFVAPRSCGGGSPRVTLLIHSDGDGNFNFAAHGHPNPFAGWPAEHLGLRELDRQRPTVGGHAGRRSDGYPGLPVLSVGYVRGSDHRPVPEPQSARGLSR